MGRPPMNFRMLNIRFSPELIDRLDALVGTHKRPEFIRQAVENAVRMAELAAKSAPKTESE